MGCINGKPSQQYSKLNQMVANLLEAYESFESYLQTERKSVFDSLKSESSLCFTEEDKVKLVSFEHDLSLFKRYKKLNKYKYEVISSKFLKNIHYCSFKLQSLLDQHSFCLQQIHAYRQSEEGAKYLTKNIQTLDALSNKMLSIGKYLQVSEEVSRNLIFDIRECVTKSDLTFSHKLNQESKIHSQFTIDVSQM